MKKKKLIYMLLLIFIGVLNFENSNAQMFWNKSCYFEGNSNSYISTEDSPNLNITGSFTIEAWINPEAAGVTQTLIRKREGLDNSGYSMYLFNGRVAIRTNSITRLVGKTVIPANIWTHINVTYNNFTNEFYMSINGLVDTSTIKAGAAPLTNTDSLFIGNGNDGPFNGILDEVRIWKESRSSGEVASLMRTSLGTSSGVYSKLVLSLTFQNRHSDGTMGNVFSLKDWSGNSNIFYNRGIFNHNLSNRPSTTIFTNLSANLDGNNDYLAAADESSFSPTAVFTLEAYVYPKSFSIGEVIIHKGLDNGLVTNYGLRLNQGNVVAYINNQVNLISQNSIPLNKWTHLAYVYNTIFGTNLLYVNGVLTDSASSNTGLVTNGNDSFYVGGTIALPDFNGYIDEVRIKSAIKNYSEINQFLYKSIDESNDLNGTELVFNLDGGTLSNVGLAIDLKFRNDAEFGNPGTSYDIPVSPLHRADNIDFNEGFILKNSDRRIPGAGTSGNMTDDSLYVYQNDIINDINVFVALNHKNENSLSITLVSPNGTSIDLYNNNNNFLGYNNSIVTVFDDESNYLNSNNTYVSFEPSIKPQSNINSAFSGLSSFGYWKLLVNDNSPGDTGRLVSWGIQINESVNKNFNLNSTSIIQGFYNPLTNTSVRDTMQIKLRKSTSPYIVIDSAKSFYLPSGFSTYTFKNAVAGTPYYLQLNHRNSIDTWSSNFITFEALSGQSNYNFTFNSAQAFGNNLIQADTSPLRFALYNGDVNKDGIVDVTDNSLVDNDAFNFNTGYIVTDLTGDNTVDLSDATIVDNNASMFISKITP